MGVSVIIASALVLLRQELRPVLENSLTANMLKLEVKCSDYFLKVQLQNSTLFYSVYKILLSKKKEDSKNSSDHQSTLSYWII